MKKQMLMSAYTIKTAKLSPRSKLKIRDRLEGIRGKISIYEANKAVLKKMKEVEDLNEVEESTVLEYKTGKDDSPNKKDNAVVSVLQLLNTTETKVLTTDDPMGVPTIIDKNLKGEKFNLKCIQQLGRKKIGLESINSKKDEELRVKNQSEGKSFTILTRIDMLDKKTTRLMIEKDRKKEKTEEKMEKKVEKESGLKRKKERNGKSIEKETVVAGQNIERKKIQEDDRKKSWKELVENMRKKETEEMILQKERKKVKTKKIKSDQPTPKSKLVAFGSLFKNPKATDKKNGPKNDRKLGPKKEVEGPQK